MNTANAFLGPLAGKSRSFRRQIAMSHRPVHYVGRVTEKITAFDSGTKAPGTGKAILEREDTGSGQLEDWYATPQTIKQVGNEQIDVDTRILIHVDAWGDLWASPSEGSAGGTGRTRIHFTTDGGNLQSRGCGDRRPGRGIKLACRRRRYRDGERCSQSVSRDSSQRHGDRDLRRQPTWTNPSPAYWLIEHCTAANRRNQSVPRCDVTQDGRDGYRGDAKPTQTHRPSRMARKWSGFDPPGLALICRRS